MEIQTLDDKATILSFLKRNPELQIYCIGDLDDFFWPHTTWYSIVEKSVIQSVALLYSGMKTPTLLIFFEGNPDNSRLLLEKIKPVLPGRFFAHLSPGLIDIFEPRNIIEYYGLHYKMALKKLAPKINDPHIRRLTPNDLQKVEEFYAISYPHNWFDKRMLETGKYFGYFINNLLSGISGIHVYSAEYRVAALGNIATHPDYRGQQIGFKLTSKLCTDLCKSVDYVGLNVRSDNEFAIKCYKKVGFEIVGEYDECLIKTDSELRARGLELKNLFDF
jgi:ribosomal protein S18 acetylase RimI-like enzyme